MPSDPRIERALAATASRRVAYRAFVLSALERVHHILSATGGADRARGELGMLGAARIDPARFAELPGGAPLDGLARARITRAEYVLRELSKATDQDFVLDMPAWRAPSTVIASALGRWGRAFGAAMAADLARVGQYEAVEHDHLTEACGFERWSRAHRLSAPPIVARMDGSNLRVADLCDVLDGAQHIAMVVDGKCPPAALVRLITPGTLVLQTSDDRGVARFAAFMGPAIAAFVPEGAACFLHDPEAGPAPWQRLNVWSRPADRPRKYSNGLSPAQQLEEMRQLEALAAQPSLPDTALAALAGAGAGDPTERLASWLLEQSGTT